MTMIAALLFGLVAGLRTFTAEGVYFGLRAQGAAAIVFPLLALGEYIGDLFPKVPARTEIGPLLARCASGAFMGWTAARIPGVVIGVAAALASAFGGYRLRMAWIARMGAVPAALIEDAIAIAIAFAGVVLMGLKITA